MLLRFAVRNIFKYLNITVIKLIGLVLGFLIVIYIVDWISFEYSYDKHFSKADRIYRFSVEQSIPERNFYWHFARTWQPWRKDVPQYFAEVEEMVELTPLFQTHIKIGEEKFSTHNAFASDSSFFKVFDVQVIMGDPIHAIDAQNTVIISEEYVKKYFPGKSPLNTIIQIERNDVFIPHTITGVFKDIPKNTHFDIDFLTNQDLPANIVGNNWAYTYVLLEKGCKLEAIQSKTQDFILAHVPENQQENSIIHFTPLTDIHLKSHIEREVQTNGDIKQVHFFLIIGLGVFFMVLVNYVNLTAAIYKKRIKVFSVNRILGAKPKHNISTLFLESSIIVTASLVISLSGYNLFIFFIKKAGFETGHELSFSSIGIILIIYLLTLCSGCLPPLGLKISYRILAQQQKNTVLTGKNNYQWFNSAMLITQFAVSILVIISGIIMTKQNKFLMTNQLGKVDHHLLSIDRKFSGNDNETLFIDELKKISEILDVTAIMNNPTYLIKDMRIFRFNDQVNGNQQKLITICPAEYNFFNFFNIDLVAGEYLKPYQENQRFINYIINEKAVKFIGFESPEQAVGCEFQLGSFNNDIPYGGKIVGVVKDFHYSSMYHPIVPTAYFQIPKYYGNFLLKVDPENEKLALSNVKKLWDKLYPDFQMEYQFLNDVYKENYIKDLQQGKLINLLAICSILITCIGLIGLSGLLLIQKTKEIGVHKVNGARSYQIIIMLNKNYIIRIVIAFILITPVAWYFMNNWLNNFAYKINLSWWIFIYGALIVLIVAIITITWQSWRTANKNPIEALRNE